MEQKNNTYSIPVAIIIAGILIAGAVYLNGQGAKVGSTTSTTTPSVASASVTVPPITSADHILGNPNAKVMIVEYSDLECPFCKMFQSTIEQALSNYSNGDVAWVYRHFTVHSKAPYEAEASECANELGGNAIFFKYIDQIFAVTKSDNNLDPAVLTTTAVNLGLDKTKFQACLDSGKYASLVAQETQDAENAGGQGTPYTILVTKNGNYPITAGAIPYSELKQMIDGLLAQLK